MSKEMHFKDLRAVLENSEKMFGNEPAFMTKIKGGNITKTYSEFASDVKSLASYLLNLDMKNKRVAIISTNRYEWSVAYFATVTSDLTVVPLDKSLPEAEFHSLIERSEADVIIYESKYQGFMDNEKANEKSSVIKYINMDTEMAECIEEGKVLYNKKNAPYKKVKIDNKAMRFMLFTSGTTSMSKCVMLCHKNICTNIEQCSKKLDIGPGDVIMSFLPIHHTFECTAGFLFPISSGCEVAYCEGLRHIVPNLKEFKPTLMVGVPTLFESMYKKVWKNIEDGGRAKKVRFAIKLSKILLKVKIDIRKKLFKQIHDTVGGNLRFFVSGAAGISPEVIRGFDDFGITIYQGYGLTETSPVVSVEDPNNRRFGSVGKAMDKLEVKLDDANEEGIGEIIVKGDTVMLGYYENEEATKEVLSKGWFRTGDLGRIDDDGFIYITGRKKDVIVLKNGKNVFPEELEALINNQIEFVKESMVYGAVLEENEVELRAKIVYDKDALKEKHGEISDEELEKLFWDKIKEINKQMPTYKYIKDIILTDEELIKTTTQKIKRFEEMKKIFAK